MDGLAGYASDGEEPEVKQNSGEHSNEEDHGAQGSVGASQLETEWEMFQQMLGSDGDIHDHKEDEAAVPAEGKKSGADNDSNVVVNEGAQEMPSCSGESPRSGFHSLPGSERIQLAPTMVAEVAGFDVPVPGSGAPDIEPLPRSPSPMSMNTESDSDSSDGTSSQCSSSSRVSEGKIVEAVQQSSDVRGAATAEGMVAHETSTSVSSSLKSPVKGSQRRSRSPSRSKCPSGNSRSSSTQSRSRSRSQSGSLRKTAAVTSRGHSSRVHPSRVHPRDEKRRRSTSRSRHSRSRDRKRSPKKDRGHRSRSRLNQKSKQHLRHRSTSKSQSHRIPSRSRGSRSKSRRSRSRSRRSRSKSHHSVSKARRSRSKSRRSRSRSHHSQSRTRRSHRSRSRSHKKMQSGSHRRQDRRRKSDLRSRSGSGTPSRSRSRHRSHSRRRSRSVNKSYPRNTSRSRNYTRSSAKVDRRRSSSASKRRSPLGKGLQCSEKSKATASEPHVDFKTKMKMELQKAAKDALEGKFIIDQKSLMTSEKPTLNAILMAGTSEKVTAQQAMMHTLAAMHAKAQELTGVAIPKYYNPAAVNPLKYAEQMQKRKLLWSKTKDTKEATAQWQGTTVAVDEKFRKLMGIREGEAGELSEEQLQKQAELFAKLDQEYAFARMATHTHRGMGLGAVSTGSGYAASSEPQPTQPKSGS